MLKPYDVEPSAVIDSLESSSFPAAVKSPRSRKPKVKKLFVLDTNVLMHDPTSLFRFDDNDLYLPIATLEELDAHKRGLSDVSRNARQASRFLDEIVSGSAEDIKKGLELRTKDGQRSGPSSRSSRHAGCRGSSRPPGSTTARSTTNTAPAGHSATQPTCTET